MPKNVPDCGHVLSLNNALDELGMLSTVTNSRKEYIKEGDYFIGKLKQMSMNGDKPSAETSKEEKSDLQKNLFFNMENFASNTGASSACESFKMALNDKEKENKTIDGLHILTMNSQFITGFNTGFSFPSFPLNELFEKSRRKIFKCNVLRKRKWRSHPYDKININSVKIVEQCDTSRSKQDNFFDLDQSASRLRTTSLSSGTSNSRKVALERYKHVGNISCQRSRSMEDLTGLEDNLEAGIGEKTKDIESVSIGIQQMQVVDYT